MDEYDVMVERVTKALRESKKHATRGGAEANFQRQARAAITVVLDELGNAPMRPAEPRPGAPETSHEREYLTRRDIRGRYNHAVRREHDA